MDLNTLLCVGRTDMYGISNCVQKQEFHPMVSSFKMDSLRTSVRKEKPDSRRSSRRSSGSPSSPSKSILRGQIGSPTYGSPTSSRNVRFTDGQANRNAISEYSNIHVNETTQTNGYDSPTAGDTSVQVYSTGLEDSRVVRPFMKSNSHPPAARMGTVSPAMTSPSSIASGEKSPTRTPGYSKPLDYVCKQQRELPRTPAYRVSDEKTRPQGPGVNQHKTMGTMAVFKDRSKSPSDRYVQRRPASATQTPIPPSGHKIIQNMSTNTYEQFVPRRTTKSHTLDILDGRKIIQNMDLGKLPKEKSIGIQTQSNFATPAEIGVQTGMDVDTQTPVDACVQTPRDACVQTPRDEGVQTADDVSTPRDASVQTPRDEGVQTTDDVSSEDSSLIDDIGNVSNAYSQTLSDDEDAKDVGVQTPRDVGVQTPREVSVQTSDTSDEEETTVATQTPSEPDVNKIIQNMDIYTNVWSNTQKTDTHSYRRFDYEDKSRQHHSSKDILTEVSDDEEVNLPSHLTEPFPQKSSVCYYDKLKTSGTCTDPGFETVESKQNVLTEHSAKQLLERETMSVPRKATYSPQCKDKSHFKQKAISARFSLPIEDGFNKEKYERQKATQPFEDKYDAGTQFNDTYHLELQAKEDRINEIAATLDFTPIETHSFDPGSNVKFSDPVQQTMPDFSRDSRENQLRNAFIKDVDLGPLPTALEDRSDNPLTDYSPPRQRLVKSVNFDSSVRDRYRDNVGPNYIFFKNTGSGSKYESFEPQPRHSARRPQRSYTSPPRTSPPKSRPVSAPSSARLSGGSKSSYLTPALSHLRKQAIRKCVTDSPRASSKSSIMPNSKCQRSDTFISSTKPPPQPLTLPLTGTTLHLSDSNSRDTGSFESLGNQPRYMVDLKSTANCRPEPKRKSRTPSPSYKLSDQSNKLAGNQRGFSTSSKPPLPRGRAAKREFKPSQRNASTETRRGDSRSVNGAATTQPRSRSVDSAKTSSRDQGTSMSNRGSSASREISSNRVTTGIPMSEQSEIFLGNKAIQKIIEEANL